MSPTALGPRQPGTRGGSALPWSCVTVAAVSAGGTAGSVLQVGERLGRYEVEKRCAVEKEDYDLAKHKKRQMEQYRSRAYAQLGLHGLVDAELVGTLTLGRQASCYAR